MLEAESEEQQTDIGLKKTQTLLKKGKKSTIES